MLGQDPLQGVLQGLQVGADHGLSVIQATPKMENMAVAPDLKTVATDTGEAVTAIWAATEEAAMGRSGRMFFLMEISAMIGSMV